MSEQPQSQPGVALPDDTEEMPEGFERYSAIVHKCTECGGFGRLPIEVEGGVQFVPCICSQRAKLLLAMDQAGIPDRYRHFDLSNLDPRIHAENQASVAVIHEYTTNLQHHVTNGHGLYVMGPYGVGKSSMVGHIVRNACWFGIQCRVARLGELVKRCLDGMKDQQARAEFEQTIYGAELLVIEDVDKVAHLMAQGAAGNLREEAVCLVFETVYDTRTALIATSNIPLDPQPSTIPGQESPSLSSVGYFPKHLVDRFRELRPVVILGESLRGSEATQWWR